MFGLRVCLCITCVQCPQRPRKGCRFPQVVVRCHVGAGNGMEQRKSCSNFTGLPLVWPWFVTVDGWGRCPSVLCSHLRDSSSKLISRQTWRLPPVLHILLHVCFLAFDGYSIPELSFPPLPSFGQPDFVFFFFKDASRGLFFFSTASFAFSSILGLPWDAVHVFYFLSLEAPIASECVWVGG